MTSTISWVHYPRSTSIDPKPSVAVCGVHLVSNHGVSKKRVSLCRKGEAPPEWIWPETVKRVFPTLGL